MRFTGFKVTVLSLLLLSVAACQSQSERQYSAAPVSKLDGLAMFDSPVRQLKPECEKLTSVAGQEAADCLDPTYVKLTSNPLTVDKARAYYSGYTIRSYDVQHGTRVEYTAANGLAYLWYPGDGTLVKGEWRIIDKAGILQVRGAGIAQAAAADNQAFVCYRYGSANGVWQCQDATVAIRTGNKEKVAGDIFNLSSGRIPYVMPKGNLSFRELKKKR